MRWGKTYFLPQHLNKIAIDMSYKTYVLLLNSTLSPEVSRVPLLLHSRTVTGVLCNGRPSNNSPSILFQISNSPFSHPTAMIFLFGCQAHAVAWQLLCNWTFRSSSAWRIRKCWLNSKYCTFKIYFLEIITILIKALQFFFSVLFLKKPNIC